ncbi:DEKNAAC100201 [Brettanomyces naardenensis]|uniref:DEKNAAC100201 n=1 Tax=Brettanomyces naardenensis TaxID=13370 RepID=A0A448YEZ7_BRENA|nr:DEKNAAC100201 [Brettanomyces naardenensis]
MNGCLFIFWLEWFLFPLLCHGEESRASNTLLIDERDVRHRGVIISSSHTVGHYSELDGESIARRYDDNPDEYEGDPESSKDGVNNGDVKVSTYTFKGKVKQYIYLENEPDSSSKDETLLALTTENKVFVTHDQGSTWENVSPEDEFLGIYLNEFDSDHAYLLAANDKVVYSSDRADNWKSFRTPCSPIPGINPLVFHPTRKSYLLWMGQVDCDNQYSRTCRTAVFISRSYGKRWREIQNHVKKCQFVAGVKGHINPELVLCQKEANGATHFRSNLVASSEDFQKRDGIIALENVIGFVEQDGFLVAATALGQDELRLHVSRDGLEWHDALFPSDFHVEKQQAYTILSGITGSLFVHVTTNPRENTEFGSLLKSNSDGQSYVLALGDVNRNSNGYVDFEQLSGLEGVMVVNIVANPDNALKGSRKKLRTVITHSDGAEWSLLNPPSQDSIGKNYKCSQRPQEECSLHLHGYTEREDTRDTFSSGSAVGMMIGVGNVGESLGNYYDGDTFLTRDGGISWKEVKKGVYMWEFGDQGSIIVLVNGKDNTNIIFYSLDQGDTWTEFKFTEEKVTVQDISTVPSDNSVKFLLFTRVPLARGDKTRLFQIDFSQILSEPCNLDLENSDTDDFELWTPRHPQQDTNCLFGHEAQYYRKIPGKHCRVGKKLTQPYKVIRNCACSRQDYECDFNYFRDSDGICKLVPGYSPPNHQDICNSEDSLGEYYLPTGYRRTSLTTCEGGHQFDRGSPAIPCKGKEVEFYQRHPITSLLTTAVIWLFGVISLIITGLFLFKLYGRSYGEIRLDEYDNTSAVGDDGPVQQLTACLVSAAVSTILFISQLAHKSAIYTDGFWRGHDGSQLNAYVVSEEDILQDEVESGSYNDDPGSGDENAH